MWEVIAKIVICWTELWFKCLISLLAIHFNLSLASLALECLVEYVQNNYDFIAFNLLWVHGNNQSYAIKIMF